MVVSVFNHCFYIAAVCSVFLVHKTSVQRIGRHLFDMVCKTFRVVSEVFNPFFPPRLGCDWFKVKTVLISNFQTSPIKHIENTINVIVDMCSEKPYSVEIAYLLTGLFPRDRSHLVHVVGVGNPTAVEHYLSKTVCDVFSFGCIHFNSSWTFVPEPF